MTKQKSPDPQRRVLAYRPSASRKLLARKAKERSPEPRGEPLEASFPPAC
jgi:hypothetical protein